MCTKYACFSRLCIRLYGWGEVGVGCGVFVRVNVGGCLDGERGSHCPMLTFLSRTLLAT